MSEAATNAKSATAKLATAKLATVRPLLVFDMDGVLVEVRESYREAIIQTVALYGGPALTQQDIQRNKARGGFNNDWLLSWTLLKESGIEVPYQEVIDAFQRIYRGPNDDGLLLRERWMPADGLLDRLAPKWQFALFTGRLREEAQWALKHFQCAHALDPLIGMDDVKREKPDPEGLLRIRELTGAREIVYVGDTADDCRSANAANAANGADAAASTSVASAPDKIRFIGIAAVDLPGRDVLLRQFAELGASAVIPDINALEEVL